MIHDNREGTDDGLRSTSGAMVWSLRLGGFLLFCLLLRYVGLIWGAVLGGTGVLSLWVARRGVKSAARPMVPAIALQAAVAAWSIVGLIMLTLRIVPIPEDVLHLTVVAPGRAYHSFSVGVNVAMILLHLSVAGASLAWLARSPGARPLALLTGYHLLCMAAGLSDLAYMRGLLEWAGMLEEARAGLVLQFALRALAIALMFAGLRVTYRDRVEVNTGRC